MIGGNQTLSCVLFIRPLTFCCQGIYCYLPLKRLDFLSGLFNRSNIVGVERMLIITNTLTLLYTLEATT